jgi:hypothetical protein
VSGESFRPSLIFNIEAKSCQSEECSTRVGSSLGHKFKIILLRRIVENDLAYLQLVAVTKKFFVVTEFTD